ncbi:MAG: large conductance mechanosensitive channel protein MscL [Pirellulales bacterium]|nr:large conductance mechanosensitive channel protein MscL [Pirellulales bacterium]
MNSWLKEFKDFAMRGNVVDLAVGVVIGGAFGDIVKILVDKIFMPVVSLATTLGAKDLGAFYFEIGAVKLGVGEVVSSIIKFVIIAFCLFLVVKGMNYLKTMIATGEIPPPAEPAADVKLLTEIRDLLKNRPVQA